MFGEAGVGEDSAGFVEHGEPFGGGVSTGEMEEDEFLDLGGFGEFGGELRGHMEVGAGEGEIGVSVLRFANDGTNALESVDEVGRGGIVEQEIGQVGDGIARGFGEQSGSKFAEGEGAFADADLGGSIALLGDGFDALHPRPGTKAHCAHALHRDVAFGLFTDDISEGGGAVIHR